MGNYSGAQHAVVRPATKEKSDLSQPSAPLELFDPVCSSKHPAEGCIAAPESAHKNEVNSGNSRKWAVKQLKKGLQVRRRSWNDDCDKTLRIELVWLRPNSWRIRFLRNDGVISMHAASELVPANDWVLYNKEKSWR